MANKAIVIGVNQYEEMQPLRYAKRDAEAMRDFLRQDAGFESIYFFADDSPDVNGNSTKPTYKNILRILRQMFESPFMGDGDNFWFFFSGHGIPHDGVDYLMPIDGDPEDVERTAISTHYVSDRLRQCGADNVVMILDACRQKGRKAGEGIGRSTEAAARRTGVISLFSCSPKEYSYEIEEIEQGAFTAALLEGLSIRGRCATVERLNQHLETAVKQLTQQYLGNVKQTPYTIAEPISRSHLILMPQYASKAEIAVLEKDAYRAEVSNDLELANQLWKRVYAASMGLNEDAFAAIQRIAIARHSASQASPPVEPKSAASKSTQPAPQPIAQPQSFTIKLYKQGLFGKTTIELEMIAIPGGKFWMGSPDGIGLDDERPRHEVAIAPFFTSKYPITQAQYQVLIGKNPSHFKGEKRSVEQVSWRDAIAFCQKLSSQQNRKFTLPSEAQWEYACRAGTETPFYFGETISTEQVNYSNNHRGSTDVGSFPSNKFGLYDMHGNVWEWCLDHWHDSYKGAPNDGSAWLTKDDNSSRLLRGGSWFNDPDLCRSAYRCRLSPALQYFYFGFRVVCV